MLLDSIPIDQAGHWLVTWGFQGEAFEALRAHADEVHFPARATIFSEGDPADGMYLVLEGMALVLARNTQGTEQTIGIVTEGQSFGELGLLVGGPRTATVTAGLDVRLLKITPEVMTTLERDNPEVMMLMYKMLAQTLAEQWVRSGPWAQEQRKGGIQ
jgi:CRP-like cAMP-binding protein